MSYVKNLKTKIGTILINYNEVLITFPNRVGLRQAILKNTHNHVGPWLIITENVTVGGLWSTDAKQFAKVNTSIRVMTAAVFNSKLITDGLFYQSYNVVVDCGAQTLLQNNNMINMLEEISEKVVFINYEFSPFLVNDIKQTFKNLYKYQPTNEEMRNENLIRVPRIFLYNVHLFDGVNTDKIRSKASIVDESNVEISFKDYRTYFENLTGSDLTLECSERECFHYLDTKTKIFRQIYLNYAREQTGIVHAKKYVKGLYWEARKELLRYVARKKMASISFLTHLARFKPTFAFIESYLSPRDLNLSILTSRLEDDQFIDRNSPHLVPSIRAFKDHRQTLLVCNDIILPEGLEWSDINLLVLIKAPTAIIKVLPEVLKNNPELKVLVPVIKDNSLDDITISALYDRLDETLIQKVSKVKDLEYYLESTKSHLRLLKN